MCTDCDPSAMGLCGPPEEASGPPPGARAVAGSSGASRSVAGSSGASRAVADSSGACLSRGRKMVAMSKKRTDKKFAEDKDNLKTNSCLMREVLFAGSRHPPSQSSSVDALALAAADFCSSAGPSRPALSSSSDESPPPKRPAVEMPRTPATPVNQPRTPSVKEPRTPSTPAWRPWEPASTPPVATPVLYVPDEPREPPSTEVFVGSRPDLLFLGQPGPQHWDKSVMRSYFFIIPEEPRVKVLTMRTCKDAPLRDLVRGIMEHLRRITAWS